MKQSSVSQRHVAHFRLRTFGARLDCFASLAMMVGRRRACGAGLLRRKGSSQ
jgi:hypothetical protein